MSEANEKNFVTYLLRHLSTFISGYYDYFMMSAFCFLLNPSSSCHSEARSAVRIALLSHFTMMRSLRRYAPQDDMVLKIYSPFTFHEKFFLSFSKSTPIPSLFWYFSRFSFIFIAKNNCSPSAFSAFSAALRR